MIKNRLKLSAQLSLGILLVAAPIFILSLRILYNQSQRQIHDEVSRHMMSMLSTTIHRVRTYMSTIETAANTNAWMLEENFHPDSLLSVSRRVVQLNSHVNGCSVTAEPDMFPQYGGFFSAYTIRQRRPGGDTDTIITQREGVYDYFEKVWYKTPRKLEEDCWVDPFNDYNEGTLYTTELIASYCKPIYQGNKMVGVISTDLSFSKLAEVVNAAKYTYPNSYYMLLGEGGRYLIHPDTIRLFKKTIFTDTDPAKDKDIITMGYEMTAGNKGFIHIRSNGELYHVSYMPVPGTGWSLALLCPDSEAMKSYYGLRKVVMALLVIGLLVILLLCRHLMRQMVRPINRLIDTTREMADGQYGATIPTTLHKGALGKLQNCFAMMQHSLNERMGCLRTKADEIRLHNQELDEAKLQAEDTVRRKNLFIQHMTQQIRMPLNVMTGFANVLRESSTNKSMVNQEELVSITELMKKNVIGLNRIMLLLYDATQTDATETLSCHRIDEVSCNKIAKECVSYSLSLFPQAGIQLETELQDTTCLLTNHFYLMCILCELLYNAVRFSDGKHIVLRVTQSDATVCFTVQDIGPGLPADMPDLTFKPFTMPENTGVGLSLAKRHAVALGGSLAVDSDYHKGCRIMVEMPK